MIIGCSVDLASHCCFFPSWWLSLSIIYFVLLLVASLEGSLVSLLLLLLLLLEKPMLSMSLSSGRGVCSASSVGYDLMESTGEVGGMREEREDVGGSKEARERDRGRHGLLAGFALSESSLSPGCLRRHRLLFSSFRTCSFRNKYLYLGELRIAFTI